MYLLFLRRKYEVFFSFFFLCVISIYFHSHTLHTHTHTHIQTHTHTPNTYIFSVLFISFLFFHISLHMISSARYFFFSCFFFHFSYPSFPPSFFFFFFSLFPLLLHVYGVEACTWCVGIRPTHQVQVIYIFI
jgi:hypothetical protein